MESKYPVSKHPESKYPDCLIEKLCYAMGVVDAFAAFLVDKDWHEEDQSLRVLYRCDDAKNAMRDAINAIRGMQEEIDTLRDGNAGMVQTLRAEVRTLTDELRKARAKVAMYETLRNEPIAPTDSAMSVCACYMKQDGRCVATKELDLVDCNGDESKCIYRTEDGTGNT